MVIRDLDENWEGYLEEWFAPFSEALGYKKRRFWAPIYLRGLLGPGERKSIEPIAERFAPGEHDQLNHFVNVARWDTAPLEKVLVEKANALVGGEDAFLLIDDTALVKKGQASVGVGRQYCGELGKKANCQALVSLTLARGEVPVPLALRLFLPEAWANDAGRRKKCGVPEQLRFKKKWEIALEELDRVLLAGATFRAVVADAGYGHCGDFRAALRERGLVYSVGINPLTRVYPADVKVRKKTKRRGRPPKHPEPSVEAQNAKELIAGLGKRAFRKITWRRGTKGPLCGRFAAVRVRVAEGKQVSAGRVLPGEGEEWLLCEELPGGERRYYLLNMAEQTSLKQLVSTTKARWSCEQMHQQMKEELGLDHYEGRSWRGLHHHALLSMIAMCFLQDLRLRGGKKKKAPAKT